MTARMKHLAIVSENYALLGRFYQALFGMQTFPEARPDSAVAVTDGYVGLNINPRRPGRQAGFDHFGFEVDDVEDIFARSAEMYPTAKYLKRPNNRPFAGISMNDPAGNVFDLSQRGMKNRTDVYAATEQNDHILPRHVKHFELRVLDPQLIARFYADVLGLREEPRAEHDPKFYLTDGHIRMIVAPWQIGDYSGSGIERPALDHLGFEVEDLEAFEGDVERISSCNPRLTPPQIAVGPEGKARLELLRRCRWGKLQLADPDGVLIDVGAAIS